MQRKIVVSLFPLTVLFIFLIACRKSSSNKSKSELLAQGIWKFDNVKVAGADASGFLDACDKDNTVTFSSTAGSGVADEGATRCDTSDPQSTTFSWSLTTNETILNVSTSLFPGGNTEFNLVSLTDTELVVSQDIDFSGSTQNAVITFRH